MTRHVSIRGADGRLPDTGEFGLRCFITALSRHADLAGRVEVGQKQLAADVGASIRSVQRWTYALQRAGVLTTQRRGLGLCNVYQLRGTISNAEGGV